MLNYICCEVMVLCMKSQKSDLKSRKIKPFEASDIQTLRLFAVLVGLTLGLVIFFKWVQTPAPSITPAESSLQSEAKVAP